MSTNFSNPYPPVPPPSGIQRACYFVVTKECVTEAFRIEFEVGTYSVIGYLDGDCDYADCVVEEVGFVPNQWFASSNIEFTISPNNGRFLDVSPLTERVSVDIHWEEKNVSGQIVTRGGGTYWIPICPLKCPNLVKPVSLAQFLHPKNEVEII